MDKKAALIQKICAILTVIPYSQGKYPIAAHDCFCEPSRNQFNFQYDEEILIFMAQAVKEKLLRDGYQIKFPNENVEKALDTFYKVR